MRKQPLTRQQRERRYRARPVQPDSQASRQAWQAALERDREPAEWDDEDQQLLEEATRDRLPEPEE